MATSTLPKPPLPVNLIQKVPSGVPKDVDIPSTGDQHPGDKDYQYGGGSYAFGNLLWANGGTSINPMGFVGYENPYLGTDRVYRFMLKHPVLRLVRAIDIAALAASEWEYGACGGATDEDVAMVEEDLNRIRIRLLCDFQARGRDHGWAGGEPRWKSAGGRFKLDSVYPLLPEITTILKTEFGEFAGLRNHMRVGEKWSVDLPAPYKAWKYTFDSDCGYVYGRSWLENVRETAWKDWLDCAQQLQKLGAKIAGMVCLIISPGGTFPGPPGKDGKPTEVLYSKAAEDTIKGLANGAAGAWFPSLGLSPDSRGSLDALKVMKELLGKSLTTMEIQDFGSTTPAIVGLLERMRHDEELMFAGGLRSARTGLEGKHGTKAEAGVHTDTGTTVAEIDNIDFAQQCQPLADAIITLNRGESYQGRVEIRADSLIDRIAPILKAFMLAALNDPTFVEEFSNSVDITDALKKLGMTTLKDFDPKAMKARIDKNSQPQENKSKNPEPQGGRPTE